MTRGFRIAPVNTLIDRRIAPRTGGMYPNFTQYTDSRLSDDNMVQLKKIVKSNLSSKVREFMERKEEE